MALRKLFAAALASLPLAALAQTAQPAEPAKPPETQQAAPPAAPATPAPAAEPAKPAAPAEPTVKVTPYGFVLANAFWNDSRFTTRDYPGQVSNAPNGGSFIMSARQSRFGVRLALKDDNWTGAEFSGTVEFDFKAGFAGTATPASTSWNAGLMRLRVASVTALWKTGIGNLSLLAGQDYGLVNPLFAESAAWVADPVFWQAGNYWRRSPQFRGTWAAQAGMLGFNVAAAMLSPADAPPAAPAGAVPGTSTDFGAGNASRQPDIEARAAVSAKVMPDVNATVGVGYHTNKRRYAAGTPDQKDTTVSGVGVDADFNLTKFLQVKGEFYNSTGLDDTYNAISPGTRFELGAGGAAATLASPLLDVGSSGYWAQAILKPIPQAWLVAGYGISQVNESDLKKVIANTGTNYADTRLDNSQVHLGLIVNAGKFWRFSLETIMAKTKYLDGRSFDANAYALSSMFRF